MKIWKKNENLPVQMPTLKIYISKLMLNLAQVLCSLQKQYKEETIVNFEHFLTCFRTPGIFCVILKSWDHKIGKKWPHFLKIPGHSAMYIGGELFLGFICHIMGYLKPKITKKFATFNTIHLGVPERKKNRFFCQKWGIFSQLQHQFSPSTSTPIGEMVSGILW